MGVVLVIAVVAALVAGTHGEINRGNLDGKMGRLSSPCRFQSTSSSPFPFDFDLRPLKNHDWEMIEPPHASTDAASHAPFFSYFVTACGGLQSTASRGEDLAALHPRMGGWGGHCPQNSWACYCTSDFKRCGPIGGSADDVEYLVADKDTIIIAGGAPQCSAQPCKELWTEAAPLEWSTYLMLHCVDDLAFGSVKLDERHRHGEHNLCSGEHETNGYCTRCLTLRIGRNTNGDSSKFCGGLSSTLTHVESESNSNHANHGGSRVDQTGGYDKGENSNSNSNINEKEKEEQGSEGDNVQKTTSMVEENDESNNSKEDSNNGNGNSNGGVRVRRGNKKRHWWATPLLLFFLAALTVTVGAIGVLKYRMRLLQGSIPVGQRQDNL